MGFLGLAWETWAVFQQASIYLLFGFSIAGIIGAFVPTNLIYSLLGKGRVRSIFLASVLGVPLPLCSCSVLPMALSLHRRGARRGATLTFLISTPETGVDSILITYGLLGPVFAVFRPIAACITGWLAGFLADAFGRPPAEAQVPEVSSTDQVSETLPGQAPQAYSELSAVRRFGNTFEELFNAIAYWVLLGLILSSVLAWLVPVSLVQRYLSGGLFPYFAMLAVGLPLYICASGSTPVAAVLIAKGLSPGAALVFLLAGPATNAAGMAVIGKTFGKRTLGIYLGTIAVMSVVLGVFLDGIYGGSQVATGTSLLSPHTFIPVWLQNVGVIALLLLLLRSSATAEIPGELTGLGRYIRRLTGLRIRAHTGRLLFALLVLLSYLSDGILYVRPGEVGLVRRFGKLVSVGGPGLVIDLPRPFSRSERLSTEEIRVLAMGYALRVDRDEMGYTWVERGSRNLDESIYYTGDQNLLDITSMLYYRVQQPKQFRFNVSDPERIIREALAASMVEVLSRRYVDMILTSERAECQAAIFERLKRTLQEYQLGVELVDYRLLDIHAPIEVHPKFREVASAAEQMQSFILAATAERVVTLADAEIFGVLERNLALSERETRVRQASGYQQNFQLRADVYRESPRATREQLTRDLAAQTLPSVRTIVVPVSSDEINASTWLLPPTLFRPPEGETAP